MFKSTDLDLQHGEVKLLKSEAKEELKHNLTKMSRHMCELMKNKQVLKECKHQLETIMKEPRMYDLVFNKNKHVKKSEKAYGILHSLDECNFLTQPELLPKEDPFDYDDGY